MTYCTLLDSILILKMRMFWLLTVAFFLPSLDEAFGHGHMYKPSQRSSLWRFYGTEYKGYKFEINYQDYELFCGGATRQWHQNDGKCGTCGDPYDGERRHELGGLYATGFISETYNEGQAVEVEVNLTAAHRGFFEYKICALPDFKTKVTQKCLDETRLKIVETGNFTYTPGTLTGVHKNTVQLPRGLVCDHCVLQWRYKAGNSWGCDLETGKCCIGCGAQETFINCADIRIIARPQTSAPTTPQVLSTTVLPSNTTEKQQNNDTTTDQTQVKKSGKEKLNREHKTSCPAGQQLSCIPWGIFHGVSEYGAWCNMYCRRKSRLCKQSYCLCRCKSAANCHAVGEFAIHGNAMDRWCNNICKDGCDDLQDMCKCS